MSAHRVLIVSLNTYSAPFNDGKLERLGQRLGSVTATVGDVPSLWSRGSTSRCGEGYEVIALPVRYARRPVTTVLRGLVDVAQRMDPTLIHIEAEPWQAVALQAIRMACSLRVPVGVQFAENGPQMTGLSGNVRRRVMSRSLRRCDYAVGWSSESASLAREFAPKIPVSVIPGTGAPRSTALKDVERWFGREGGRYPKLAFIGRFSAEKGIKDFREICDSLSRRTPIRVALAGGDSSDGLVSDWVRERPWASVHGVVSRPDAMSIAATADALLCPSRTLRHVKEQFGKAPVEAMLAGTPVFAYDCGALAEVIGPGGVVVAEGDVQAMVAALERHFNSDGCDRERLSTLARSQAQRFTDDAVADQLIALWSRVSALDRSC